jgi:hypothetical protein
MRKTLAFLVGARVRNSEPWAYGPQTSQPKATPWVTVTKKMNSPEWGDTITAFSVNIDES